MYLLTLLTEFVIVLLKFNAGTLPVFTFDGYSYSHRTNQLVSLSSPALKMKVEPEVLRAGRAAGSQERSVTQIVCIKRLHDLSWSNRGTRRRIYCEFDIFQFCYVLQNMASSVITCLRLLVLILEQEWSRTDITRTSSLCIACYV